jgi:hypothetical protein
MKINTRSTSTSMGQQASLPPRVGGQPLSVDVLLFGKRPARLVDPRRFPHLKKAMQRLGLAKDQLAELLGVGDSTFSLALAEGNNASINRDGRIAFGCELLELHQENDPLLVAIIAHEIGHQPWDWPERLKPMSKRALDAMSREEEAKADRFAGRALADLAVSPDPICDFLLAQGKFERHPPADYYPAEQRAQMIAQAFTRRRKALVSAAHLSPRALERQRQLR